jgi:flagellar basal-body rod protein FlgF
MDPSFYTLAAAAGYGENRMAIVANNLANANTPGYKADQVSFSTMLSEATGLPEVGATQYVELTPGAMEQTGNPLDVALAGDGFFVVNTADGRRFTRDGAFQMTGDGAVVTADGNAVMGEGGPLVVDPDAGPVTIDGHGKVFQDGAQLDTLAVVTFPSGAPPVKVGGNLFDGTGDAPVEEARVIQGAMERSNVSAVLEMTRMIEIARGYEAYQKMVQTLDQTAAQTNNVGSV